MKRAAIAVAIVALCATNIATIAALIEARTPSYPPSALKGDCVTHYFFEGE